MSHIKNHMKTLGTIFGNEKFKRDDYLNLYSIYINELAHEKNTNMIEIGTSNNSINTWLHLFPYIHLYSLDIYNENIEYERVTMVNIDQSKEKDLDNFLIKNIPQMSLIIDDGSHIPEHQLLTFNKLFSKLKVNGIYIIENIQTSYWTKKDVHGYETMYGYKNPRSIVEIFKNVVDCVNMDYIKKEDLFETPILNIKEIGSISFGKNCIIISKREYSERPYIFEDCL